MIRTSRDLLPLELKLSIGTFSGVEWSFAERADSSFSPKGPAAVRHLRLRPGMSLDDLVREMSGTRVLGGGRIGEATDVVAEMFREPSYTNFLTIAGPMVPAGFRLLFGDLIDRGFIDALVTTGANLTHDVIESLGLHHYQGSFHADDRKLIQAGYSRIADIFVKETSVAKIVEMAMTADKIGVVILGGGLPKHHTLLASVLREGVDRAVQITSDRAEPGGLSGAPLAESISWRKIRKGGKFVDVYGDATV